MNDRHVVALLYQIDHGRSVDYRDAKPIDREEEGFCVKVSAVRLSFRDFSVTSRYTNVGSFTAASDSVRRRVIPARIGRPGSCGRIVEHNADLRSQRLTGFVD
jgi:hypothetical protein